jgi:uncharacterized protein
MRGTPMSIDQQFVEFVIKSLVTKPEAVKIERRIDEKGVLLELTVDPEDLGRVIGKRGATAQSVRTLLRALGTKNDARYNLKIVDNGVVGKSHSSSTQDDDSDDSAFSTPTEEANSDDVWSSSVSSTSDDSDNDDDENDMVAKTRRELKDLDDLDV